MSNDRVILDLRHRVPSGISEYALTLSPLVARELVKLKVEPVLVVARHQLRRLIAEKELSLVVAPTNEHYVHFDSELADIIRKFRPKYVHSFGPMVDPRWSERFSITWHDAMRLQVKQLVYSDSEILLRTTPYELRRLQAFDSWCEQRFGSMPTTDSLHGRSLRWYAWLARERAAFVATVSQTSRHEVQRAMGLAEPPVVLPPLLRPLTAPESCPGWVTDLKPFFLFVGTPEEHKRLDLVCEVLFACTELDHAQVVVVGDIGHASLGFRLRRYLTAELLESPRVVRLGHVSDSRLAALYVNATAILLPSTYEGYCLPAAESISLGGVLLANDIPVLREVIGEYPRVTWFDLGDPPTLVRALSQASDAITELRPSDLPAPPARGTDSAPRLAHCMYRAMEQPSIRR